MSPIRHPGGYLTRAVCEYPTERNGFGHTGHTTVYRLNGTAINPFAAQELLAEHLRGIPKQGGRQKNRPPLPERLRSAMEAVAGNGRYVMGDVVPLSNDPHGAERLRQRLVPGYEACPHAAIVRSLYDPLGEETPIFAGCEESQFSREYNEECLGQCAPAGRQYGRPEPSMDATFGDRTGIGIPADGGERA